MNHACQLNLTDDQKAFVRSEIQRTTASFQDLQWKLQDQMEQMQETMKPTSVNEQQALAQLGKVVGTRARDQATTHRPGSTSEKPAHA
jgi:hypothetical protein